MYFSVSGINMGIQLSRQLQVHDYLIVEKVRTHNTSQVLFVQILGSLHKRQGSELGGTWFFNTYPGAGCDIPSHFYSFSFAPNPDWSHQFSMQGEISTYIKDVAHKYDIPKHCLFSTECLGARWNAQEKLWRISMRDEKSGRTYEKTAKAVVSAVGVLGVANECPLPGKEVFKGHIWHSSRWNHDVPVTDKRVVVVGNGCSATQFVPVIAKEAKSIHQFVRGTHYYMERPNQVYSSSWKWAFRHIPGFYWAYRFLIYVTLDVSFKLFRLTQVQEREAVEKDTIAYIKKNAPEKYQELLIPKFRLGQKRRVFDTDYLSTLSRDNMHLSDTRLKQIVAEGVETVDGEIIPADIIVLANGFKAQDFLVPMDVVGDGGISLEQRWKEQQGARAYRGAVVPGFPNFVMLIGPNTVQGHFSVIYTSECAVNYAVKILQPALAKQKVVRVKEEAEKKYNSWLQSELRKLVWSEVEEVGWYADKKSGHNPTIYPAEQTRFWWQTLFPVWNDFEVSAT